MARKPLPKKQLRKAANEMADALYDFTQFFQQFGKRLEGQRSKSRSRKNVPFWEKPRRPPSKFNYVIAILVNFLLLYVFNHLLEWKFPFVTLAWNDAVWALNLSIAVHILAYALLIIINPLWVRRLMKIVQHSAGFLSTLVLYSVFPFDLGPGIANVALHWAFLIALIVIPIVALVEVARLFTGSQRT